MDCSKRSAMPVAIFRNVFGNYHVLPDRDQLGLLKASNWNQMDEVDLSYTPRSDWNQTKSIDKPCSRATPGKENRLKYECQYSKIILKNTTNWKRNNLDTPKSLVHLYIVSRSYYGRNYSSFRSVNREAARLPRRFWTMSKGDTLCKPSYRNKQENLLITDLSPCLGVYRYLVSSGTRSTQRWRSSPWSS